MRLERKTAKAGRATAGEGAIGELYAADRVLLVIDRSRRGRDMLEGMLDDDPTLEETVDDFHASGYQFLVTLTNNWTTGPSWIVMAKDEAALVDEALPYLARQLRSRRLLSARTAFAFAVANGMEERLKRSIERAGAAAPRRLRVAS